jgi:TolB-like protein/Tfp pilus assembly protein PilF
MALVGELRRRNIFKVSLAYMIVSWITVQVADVILPTFQAPDWVMQVLVLFLILAFPVAVLLAWAFELTPQGLKPTSDVDQTQSITVETGQKLNHVVIALLGIAVVVLIIDNYIFPDTTVTDPDVAYRRAIAVIPFSNGSIAEENAEFFSAGIHDELLTRLAKISDLKVVSRTSVMEYKDTTKNIRQIGEELQVGSILEGGVQLAGDVLRINVQLVDSLIDEPIWAETYEREFNAANLFAIQGEISTTIAAELKARLSDAEQSRINAAPTESMAALEAYYAGKYELHQRAPDTMLTAIQHFSNSVKIDPQFGPAWAGLAETWLELPNYIASVDPMRVRMEATAAANRAIALDPESPDAAATFAWHELLYSYDWVNAEETFQKALAIDASNINALHWYSHLLSWKGQHGQAIALARQAVQADPLSTLMATNLSYILADARQWDEAFDLGSKVFSNQEYSSLTANLWIGKMRARRALDAALDLERWAKRTNRDLEAAISLGEILVRVQTGEEISDDIGEIIGKLHIETQLPEVYAALGDAENTIATLIELQKSGIGFRSILSMRINPAYDFVREDPRFQTLLETVGLNE